MSKSRLETLNWPCNLQRTMPGPSRATISNGTTSPEFEHLNAPFEISPGIVIPPGSYQWTRFRTEANTATKRSWVVDAALWWGGFYTGTRR
jgi:hypothetical protein